MLLFASISPLLKHYTVKVDFFIEMTLNGDGSDITYKSCP